MRGLAFQKYTIRIHTKRSAGRESLGIDQIRVQRYGAPAVARTRDPLIKSQLLYQLSYRRAKKINEGPQNTVKSQPRQFMNFHPITANLIRSYKSFAIATRVNPLDPS